jgi:hypothetical protein
VSLSVTLRLNRFGPGDPGSTSNRARKEPAKSEPVATTSQGVAYPGGDGEIVHIYTDSAHRTITVEQRWTATFTTPAGTVDLPARTRTDTFDIQVHEYRAVRTGD